MSLFTGFMIKEIFGDGIANTGQSIIQYVATKINQDKNVTDRYISVYQPIVEEGKFRLIRNSVPGRTLNSMVLSPDAINTLKIVEQVLNSSSSNNIPNRYAILLYGPPGNGKSQFVSALATECNVPLTTLTLSTILLSDNTVISKLFSSFKSKSIILIDDADTVFYSETSKHLPLDTLLSGIDGAYIPHNIIYILSCNSLDNIPHKLLRRFPHVINFMPPTLETSLLLFEKYFPWATPDNKVEFHHALSSLINNQTSFSFSDLEAVYKKSLYLPSSEQISHFITNLTIFNITH